MTDLSFSLTQGAGRAPSLIARLFAARSLARQRAALAALDDALLDDLGLTRADAVREAQRSVWDAPQHWTK